MSLDLSGYPVLKHIVEAHELAPNETFIEEWRFGAGTAAAFNWPAEKARALAAGLIATTGTGALRWTPKG
jgi:hypothetical protein